MKHKKKRRSDIISIVRKNAEHNKCLTDKHEHFTGQQYRAKREKKKSQDKSQKQKQTFPK